MEIVVNRTYFTGKSTIGKIYIDGKYHSFSLEDRIRPEKIKHETAIPFGRYEVKLTYSPKYGRIMPEIMNVPNFTGIRIHAGNDNEDTSGCLLAGFKRGEDWIGDSREASRQLEASIVAELKAGKQVFIEFKKADPLLLVIITVALVAVLAS